MSGPRPPLRLLRLANPLVRAVLGSRAHPALSGALVVLTYRGRRSGREFRIPLQYVELPEGRIVAVAVGAGRKLWWRSFAEPAAAELLLRGRRRPVHGRVLAGAARREALRAYLARFARAAGPLGVRRGAGVAELDAADAVVVAFDPR